MVAILRPLVRVLLRYGVSCKAFTEAAKAVYVEVAEQEFRIPGRKQSDSRISVITGLSRKEVKRVKETEMPEERRSLLLHNRASRVIMGWTQDPEFTDDSGSPQDLNLDDRQPGFPELVRRYSGDAPVRAVLDELERVGAVERIGDNTLALLTRAYISQTDDVEKIQYMGVVVGQMIRTIDHNFWSQSSDPFFQRIVANQHISTADAPRFRAFAKQRGQQLLEQLDKWLAENEVPYATTDAEETETRHVGVGVYYFEE